MASGFFAWWTRDLRVSSWVFMGCTLLNVFLLCMGLVVAAAAPGPIAPGQVSARDIWYWVFAFPAMLAWQRQRELPDWTPILMVALNPWLYGLMGWSAWRMVKLVWGKREPE
jgi:hypothetical protein